MVSTDTEKFSYVPFGAGMYIAIIFLFFQATFQSLGGELNTKVRLMIK